jgi:magnesium transporter
VPKRAHRRRAATIRKRRHQPGAPPGTISHAPEGGGASLHLITYGPDGYDERTLGAIDEVVPHVGRDPVLWLDVIGLADARTFTRMGEIFGLHPLALEDAVNTHQQPKMEDYQDRVFVVVRIPETPGDDLLLEQVSLFIGPRFLVTIQERAGDCLDPVRERIRRAGGRVRAESACYLAYSVIDAIVDRYYPLVESYGERLEVVEAAVVERADPGAIAELYGIRHDLHTLRRTVWPSREAADRLSRLELAPIQPSSRIFFRDAADHLAQVADAILGLQDLSASLMEMHLAATSNRMNEVMKVLTLIATIFIPLGFVASLWGMNFDPEASPWNMPELEWAYGYPMALLLMLGIAVSMLVFFRRRGWWG